jgi:hypothetical protein
MFDWVLDHLIMLFQLQRLHRAKWSGNMTMACEQVNDLEDIWQLKALSHYSSVETKENHKILSSG